MRRGCEAWSRLRRKGLTEIAADLYIPQSRMSTQSTRQSSGVRSSPLVRAPNNDGRSDRRVELQQAGGAETGQQGAAGHTLTAQSTGHTTVLHARASIVFGQAAPSPACGVVTSRARIATPPSQLAVQLAQLDQPRTTHATATTVGSCVGGADGDGDGENVGVAVGDRVPASYAKRPVGLVPSSPATITAPCTALSAVPTGLPHAIDVPLTQDDVVHRDGRSKTVGEDDIRPKLAPLTVRVAPPNEGKFGADA
jgi:hypothetical protein